MKVIVGLGNPGPRYKDTRHNIGYMVLEELASRWPVQRQDSKFDAIIGHTIVRGQKVLLVKPLTYMNLSGAAIQPLMHYYKLPPEDLLLILDDMDLPPGTLRIREGGGSGGHKGLKSVLERMGIADIPRMRIGIGRPENHETVDWVLSRIEGEDADIIRAAITKAADAVECFTEKGIIAAMNAYNKGQRTADREV
ncbi:MAG: aminoacyl-tRNA hydrolase [Syntrophomonadaceae bacterium]|nr:aminoacyl-tRNA hydrolase [Syntrophomonadaceae bacterium]